MISCALAATVAAVPIASGISLRAEAAVFKENPYMAQLDLPTFAQYEEKDWKKTTTDFLAYVFDEDKTYTGTSGERKIARYTESKNAKAYFASIGRPEEAPEEIWSIPPYIAKGTDNALGEGITVIAAVMSGALAGMDLTAYKCSDGVTRNFVKSVVEYYQAQNGANIVLNGGAGGEAGVTWWYELLPGVLFSVLGTQYESEAYYTYDIITESARQWRSAVEGLGGANADFWHTSYDFKKGEPVDNGRWFEPDAAAGMAYILYSAYALNSNLIAEGKDAYATEEEIEEFREAAVWSMNYLEKLDQSPFYEVLTFLAPYLAARMNAEQGTNYDVAKMFGWLMDGSSAVRGGWGMITENWGDKYTEGLMGSLTDGDGYAFAMNTFDAMLGFGPMAKYDTRFARDISRWVLCASQSARAYYPSEYKLEGKVEDAGEGHQIYHGKWQSGNWIAPDSPEAESIAYEGLRRYRRYVVWEDGKRSTKWDKSVTPYASGDAFTFDWGGETDYGLYGSAHVGLFGSTIEYTDVPMIIRTDLNKLDVYNGGSIPFTMYYNPYDTEKVVSVKLVNAGGRLYDTVEKEYVKTSGTGTDVKMTIPADTTFVLAEIPAGKEVVKDGSNYTCDGEFVATDRGSVELALHKNADGTGDVDTSEVTGTVYVDLDMIAPAGATVDSLVLSYGGVKLYEGKTAPTKLIEIDTKTLKNGQGVLRAVLQLSGGRVEKASIPMRVLNVVKTPALEYENIGDMVSKWNAATTEWNTRHPESDHTSVAKVGSNGELTVEIAAPKGYGFATSELFMMDFSRGPMIELEVTDVSSSYAIKLYVEGMSNTQNYTGAYLVKDTNETGKLKIDILEEIRKDDPYFNMTGSHPTSIKIIPTGSQGDTVSIKDLNVYHMYQTPVLEEPDSYEWTHDFTSEWISLWSGAEGDGGVNNANLEYTNEGTVRVGASDATKDYSAIASPLITTDLGQNPVFDLTLAGVTGKYFVGVKFNGDDRLFVIEDNRSELTTTVEIMKGLRANYPDDTFKGIVDMRIVLGVKKEGVAEFKRAKTYFKLPAWDTKVEGEAWIDWEKSPDTTAIATWVLDASDRIEIKNCADTDNNTATAGIRGKFTLNFDYNPELSILVVGSKPAGTQWRLTMKSFDGGATYPLTEWSAKTSLRNPVKVNLNSATDNAFAGKQNMYLAIEVLGGGSAITVKSLDTYYTAINPDFETGATLTTEMATWSKDKTNPSSVAVKDGKVVLAESAANSRGLFAAVAASAAKNPYIVLKIASLGEGSTWYLNVKIDDEIYVLTGKEGSAETGEIMIDIVRALAEVGYEAKGDFTAEYEFGGMGVGFSVTYESVRFVNRIVSPAELQHNETDNVITWQASAGAVAYDVRIEDAKGIVKVEKTVAGTSLELGQFGLETGVYRVYISAHGDNLLDSAESKLAFKQGDIESVTLGKPADIGVEGMKIVWDAVADAEYYEVVLTDVDGNKTIATAESAEPEFDLATVGLHAFNYKISVTAKGDGVVYLDGETVEYAFYTNVVENYNAKKFASMASNDNQATAAYDDASGIATLTVPYTNWGSIMALETEIDFDKSPVLAIRFAEGCEGGYFLKISVDGTMYYLADNTFTIHGNAAAVDIYVDVCATLASRKDGPTDSIAGKHKVRVVFGATSDGFAGVSAPVVKFESARLIEMTQGAGVAKLGTLAAPVVSVTNQIVTWGAVDNAEEYIVVVSNETGVLMSQTVTDTMFDCTRLKREGVYTVQVTATAARYYSSETGTAVFEITEEGDISGGDTPNEDKGGCNGSIAAGSVIGAFCLLLAAAVLLSARRKQR